MMMATAQLSPALHLWPCRNGPAPGLPLVLIHGWGSDSNIWESLKTGLTANRDLIAIDLPGFCGSDENIACPNGTDFNITPGSGRCPGRGLSRPYAAGMLHPSPQGRVYGVSRQSPPGMPAGLQSANKEVGTIAPPQGLNALLDQLADHLPDRFALLGWSLGGMIATALAARFPERVEKLVTIASNARFVACDDWQTAMSPSVFVRFRDTFAADPAFCLKQFAGLQARGDSRERAVLRELRLLQVSPTGDSMRQRRWREALALLGEMDNRHALAGLAMPSLHLFGEEDGLVPAACADAIAALNPHLRVRRLPGIAHVPHLSDPAMLATVLDDFLAGGDPLAIDPFAIDKRQIAASFSRAADRYDQVAHLQREVGQSLLALLDGAVPPLVVADLGAGTGGFTGRLRQRYPDANVLGIDLAEGMVRHARARQPGCRWLCGDAEALPLAGDSIGLLFSNFAFQWCQNLQVLAAELHRVLTPGGRLVFSAVGPHSLLELRQAWAQVDDRTHVNRFVGLDDWQAALTTAGFALDRIESLERRRYYPALNALTTELKGLGAHNLNGGRPRGMTPRRHIAALKAAYEGFRTPQGLPATWEVITVVARRPAEGGV